MFQKKEWNMEKLYFSSFVELSEGNSMGEDTEVRSSAAFSRDSQQLDNPGLY